MYMLGRCCNNDWHLLSQKTLAARVVVGGLLAGHHQAEGSPDLTQSCPLSVKETLRCLRALAVVPGCTAVLFSCLVQHLLRAATSTVPAVHPTSWPGVRLQVDVACWSLVHRRHLCFRWCALQLAQRSMHLQRCASVQTEV